MSLCENALRKMGLMAIMMMLSYKREALKLKKGCQEDTTEIVLLGVLKWLTHLLKWDLKGDIIIRLIYLERKHQGRGKDNLSERIILA